MRMCPENTVYCVNAVSNKKAIRQPERRLVDFLSLKTWTVFFFIFRWHKNTLDMWSEKNPDQNSNNLELAQSKCGP